MTDVRGVFAMKINYAQNAKLPSQNPLVETVRLIDIFHYFSYSVPFHIIQSLCVLRNWCPGKHVFFGPLCYKGSNLGLTASKRNR